MLDDVEAVVLVGGKGTRLRPLTLSAPKPMLPTAGVPFLAHLLSRIQAAGVRRVVLGTSYLAETFSEHFGDGSALGLEIEYVVEDEPLGTGGGIRNVAKYLTADDVLVFNGDVLAGTDLSAVVDTHRRTEADVTLHLVSVQDPRAFGCVPTDEDGRVLAFLEKTEDPPTDQINAGCYVFRRVGDRLDPGGPAGVGGARDVPRPARGRRAGVRARRRRLLARHGHPARPGARLGRPGPRRRPLGRAARPDRRVAGAGRRARSTRRRACSAARTVGRGVRIGAGARVEGSMLFDGAVVGDERASSRTR